MVLLILLYYLALAIGHRAGVGSLTQTLFSSSLPRRAGGDGPVGGALIGDGRVVAFAVLPRVTAVLFIPLPPRRHY